MDIQAIEDEEFGPLRWNAELLEWQGESQMSDSTPFHLSISTPASLQYPHIDKTKPDSTITREARLAFRGIRRGDAHIRAKLGDKYVGRYAEWHDGDSITTEDFQGRLQLETIRVLATGEAEIYYSDDDMFYGHSLIAHLKADGTVSQVELFG